MKQKMDSSPYFRPVNCQDGSIGNGSDSKDSERLKESGNGGSTILEGGIASYS